MRIRTLSAAAISAVVLLGTAGCGVYVSSQTLEPYLPSDGVATNVGDIAIRNVFFVANDQGDAALVASVVNNSDNLQFLNLEVQGPSKLSSRIGAYPGLTKVGIADDNPTVFYDAGLVPGQYVDVYFQYGANEGQLVSVPVLDDSESYYAPYLPTPMPTPTASATPAVEG